MHSTRLNNEQAYHGELRNDAITSGGAAKVLKDDADALEVLETVSRDAAVFHLALQGCVALQEGPIDAKKEARLES